MLTGMMSSESFLFWYAFIMAWFFIAATVVYFVVIKDGLDAMKAKAKSRVQQEQLVTVSLAENKIL